MVTGFPVAGIAPLELNLDKRPGFAYRTREGRGASEAHLVQRARGTAQGVERDARYGPPSAGDGGEGIDAVPDHLVGLPCRRRHGRDREYLEPRDLDEFDEWSKTYVNPFVDLRGVDFDRNFNSSRRIAELEADGVVAEVLFPNTIPPFFPSGNLVAPQPSAEEYERRWGAEGTQPLDGRLLPGGPAPRAGIHRADHAERRRRRRRRKIRWAADAGLTGGAPGVPPGPAGAATALTEVRPIWAACAELDVVVNHHGGGASPNGLMAGQTGGAIYLISGVVFAPGRCGI